ncbi:MAG TPA: rod shape-determining protein MreC [Thermodesulfobacteriota bacterium]|nr:rod shape-determining protein MreC [Thermodesulfobacteriota bacterium]
MRMSERHIVSLLKRNRMLLASVALALFSLHLALTDRSDATRGFVLKEALSALASPLQRAVLATEHTIKGVWSDYIYLVEVKDENEELKKAVLKLQEENNSLREDVFQNARLKQVLDYKENAGFTTIAAGVMGQDLEGWTKTITINKGSSEGVLRDQAVISPLGVVGRVIEVTSHSSKVLVNLDVRSDIDVLVQRSRVKGVVEGTGSEALILKYIRQADDVQVGDLILTSGLSGTFPKGLVVGEVVKIEKSRENFFKYVEVRPKMEIQRLEEVLLVKDSGFFTKE